MSGDLIIQGRPARRHESGAIVFPDPPLGEAPMDFGEIMKRLDTLEKRIEALEASKRKK